LYTIFSSFTKYRVSAQNLMGLAFDFTDKILFTTKIGQKFIFHPCEAHILPG
jgi:hypothetical protein